MYTAMVMVCAPIRLPTLHSTRSSNPTRDGLCPQPQRHCLPPRYSAPRQAHVSASPSSSNNNSNNSNNSNNNNAPVHFHYRVTRERLGQLRQFKEEHGHAFVPYKEPSGLGRWIAEQRYRYQRGLCDVSIYRELSRAGVPLRVFEARWETRFQQLSRFHALRGHAFIQNADTKASVEEDGSESYKELYAWVLQQRQLRKQGRLSESRQRRLDALGFVWDVQLHTWRENMALLTAYHEKFGHVRVPRGWPGGPKLYLFLRKVQQSSKLVGIDPNDDDLRPFHARISHSHSRFARSLVRQDPPFADVPYASLDDVEALRSMGAVRARRRSWESRFDELRKGLKEARGGVGGGVDKDEGLEAWLRSQRYAYRQGTLSEDRRRRLEGLGVELR